MLTGKGIDLRFLEESDAAAVVALNQRNREFFEPYSIERPEAFYTVEYQQELLRADLAAREADQKYAFGVFLQASQELIGVLSLTEIIRGPYQSAWLGYYLDKAHNGRGYTTEAVRRVVKYAFQVLQLHRIDAGVMPHNLGSVRVLEKAGFHREGLNKKNVLIRGRWADHLHFAVVNPIRRARADEGPVLTDLALRSKAVWGYDASFLDACRAELTLTPDDIRSSEVFVMEPDDEIQGFYAFSGETPVARLNFLYVHPDCVRRGVGSLLWEHAVANARRLGFRGFSIDSDPHAESFYLKMGAQRVGEVPSGSIPGRMLPLLRYDTDNAVAGWVS
ncbi:MAG: GNAT family N-acetyltransferase [Alicyclobacillus sp.]|nr:GNAT family N-acetyltransferase [Alicyclobacillus sp.]